MKGNTKYVVSYRIGTDLLMPDIFDTKEEAEAKANDFIYSAAYDSWLALDGGDPPETNEELEEWAEGKGFTLSDTFFWDGGSDAYEAMISEYEEPGFSVKVEDGEVFINGKFVAQLCWDNDAVAAAIGVWLNEQDEEEV